MCYRCEEQNSKAINSEIKSMKKKLENEHFCANVAGIIILVLCLMGAVWMPWQIWYNTHCEYLDAKTYAESVLKTYGNKGKIIAINDQLTSGKYARHYYETILELKDECRVSVDTNQMFPKIDEEYEITFSERWTSPFFKIIKRLK